MDHSEMDALFAQTLIGEYESDEAWNAIARLRSDGSREIFERAASWFSSDEPLKRARGAAILAQLRSAPKTQLELEKPEWLFRDESFALLKGLLEHEENSMVIDSVVAALGHLDNLEAAPLIARYENHFDKDVRFSVACALGSYPNDPIAVDVLLRLTSDVDCDVRDWAVFGLGVQGDVDTAEIREALFCGLSDEDEDVREESAVGLAKRHDLRVLPELRKMLHEPRLKVRPAEAVEALLGIESEDTSDWTADDYEAALVSRFNLTE